MDISWKIFSLPLASTFKISKGTFTHRRALIIELAQDGCRGLGEATEISYYGISLERFIKMITQHIDQLKRIPLKSTEDYYLNISKYLGSEPFLMSAFDCAAHDLFGHLMNKPTREILNLNLNTPVMASSFTIGIGPVAEMCAKIKQKPWPIYKIKLGTEEDIDIIRALRQETDAILRVDANGGWNKIEAIKNSHTMAQLRIEFIEQPLPAEQDDQMPEIYKKSSLPLIADESCQTEVDVAKCQNKFHGINIKLMKCGGLTIALRMIEEARTRNLKIMIGCMTETSIGISAAAQLISLVDYVDLDGALLIKRDIASGVSLVNGYPAYPAGNGLGCDLLDAEILHSLHEEK